jgi:hypothetical protein
VGRLTLILTARPRVWLQVVLNLAVVRPDRQAAFDVSTKGTYSAIRAAVDNGHERFVNTGPHFTHIGHTCV